MDTEDTRRVPGREDQGGHGIREGERIASGAKPKSDTRQPDVTGDAQAERSPAGAGKATTQDAAIEAEGP